MNLTFYLRYAARNLWRNRRWSTFAILSVAAGVAAVVALRSLGLAIGDALTDNLRGSNRGDLALEVGGSSTFGSATEPGSDAVFSDAQMQAAEAWAAEHDASLTATIFLNGTQLTRIDAQTAGRPQFINALFIDPQTYPLTQDIYALQPEGVPLAELFQGGNEVVVSSNLADDQGITVGDTVRVSGTEETFTVRGIVAAEAEGGLRAFASEEIFSVFFGFAYFSRELAGTVIPITASPNRLYVNLPDGTSSDDITRLGQELERTLARVDGGNFVRTTTVVDVLRQNQFIADLLGRFIVVMGLGAMLLGGIGIINTMLVMVRRRTDEIAALKTFGLKGRQVAGLFIAEAFLLGLAGSLVGSVIGTLLSGLTNSYGEAFIQQSLAWRIYPEAILFGLAIGVIVSVIFGVLPVITAARIRPAIILRPNETYIPVAGALQSLLAVMFVVVSLGVIAGQILGSTIFGVIGVAITLLLLGLIALLLWVVVWLVGKIPAFGWVDLKLALRNLSTRRFRTATTLLALSAGMFALSSISFFGAGVRDMLNFALTEQLGGNVMIFPLLPAGVARPIIDARLDTLEGVEYRTRVTSLTGQLIAVDGQQISENLTPQEESRIRSELREAGRSGDFTRMAELSAQLPEQFYLTATIRDTDNPNPQNAALIAGRLLTPEDTGKQVVVVRLNSQLESYNVQVGSQLTLNMGAMGFNNNQPTNGELVNFEVVGLLSNGGNELQSSPFEGDLQLPAGAVPTNRNLFEFTVVQVTPEHLNDVLVSLTSIPLVFALDISFFDTVLSRMIEQFSALPILVGLLSLAAAAVIMANTVALATLERRRQIGILKAVGLKGNRVLGVMLLENILISLLGGVLGIGLSALGVYLMTSFGLDIGIVIPPDSAPVAIALVIAAVLIGAVATFLSASVTVRERVLNVLRYE